MALNQVIVGGIKGVDFLNPALDLFLRLWIAYIFLASGFTKIQSWDTTLFLFEYEYDVPFLPHEFAAISGTAAEIILPILLALGLFTRFSAIALFIFNIVAVYAYRSYLYEDGYAGLIQHFYWGFLMLIILFRGPGRLSLDYLLNQHLGEWHPTTYTMGQISLLAIIGILVSAVFLTALPTWDAATPLADSLALQLKLMSASLVGYLGISVSLISFFYYLALESAPEEPSLHR